MELYISKSFLEKESGLKELLDTYYGGLTEIPSDMPDVEKYRVIDDSDVLIHPTFMKQGGEMVMVSDGIEKDDKS